MIPEYTKIHNRFKINGISYLFEELREVAYSHVKEGLPFERIIGDFLIDWLDSKDYVLVQTSGSTGTPKSIRIKKQAMVHSAIATGDFFKLKPGDKALHCLPTQFIAGKMMLVRAMILGLELDIIEPTSNPGFDYQKPYDFCAMVPLQVEQSIERLNHIKTLIVGGASISYNLQQNLQGLKTRVYATYGLTETITHIAVKSLQKTPFEKVPFVTLPNVSISQDKRDCLVIEAPHLFEGKLVTNDIVKLHSEPKFDFLGRYDNVINSGGVKLFPESIEAKLSVYIENDFFIASEEDESLGEKVILIVEGSDSELDTIQEYIKQAKALTKFEVPKAIYFVSEFVKTTSGKIQRNKTKAKVIE